MGARQQPIEWGWHCWQPVGRGHRQPPCVSNMEFGKNVGVEPITNMAKMMPRFDQATLSNSLILRPLLLSTI